MKIVDAHSGASRKKIILFIAALLLGYAAWILPLILIPGPVKDEAPIMITFSTDPEKANFYTLVLLTACGVFLGLLTPGNYKQGALLGAATGLPMVVLSFVEGVLGIASHTLWGIEVFMYMLFTIPAILGALIGTFIKRLISRGNK